MAAIEVRASLVTSAVISERNLRNYTVAMLVSFWKYIGYLGFPLQMVRQYPELSRLMAGRWAKSMANLVPVFGETGGLLEHAVFDLFFNLPLSVRRAFKANPLAWSVGTVLVTGVLLAFGRGIGDAAAVLFTAGYTDHMPSSLLRPVASLPLAVFFQLSTPFPQVQERAYASALVLMNLNDLSLVLTLSLDYNIKENVYVEAGDSVAAGEDPRPRTHIRLFVDRDIAPLVGIQTGRGLRNQRVG